ncbi:MAG TPA: hypothetical protein VH302_04525 [Bryobacteraceae bacterium]|nr:hypothetical protein [Bryobacteraceae bacterium]
MTPKIAWPQGKSFAFTVFDDPDGHTWEARKHVYPFLADLGFRTTKAVWPMGPLRERNSNGETCADPEYLDDAQKLQERGFEIGYHCAAPHSCTREEVIQSLELFRTYFGRYPAAMANHYNADAMYWGQARLSGTLRRGLYNMMTRGSNNNRFRGQLPGPHFWGDVCREKIRFCRNLVFRDINTLKACPIMPYHDPDRSYVGAWYSSAEGAEAPAFLETIKEQNQDQLEAEGGLCIMYTHFGKKFVNDDNLDPRFRQLMERLSRKNGWFVPLTTVLDHLVQHHGIHTITPGERSRLEWKWLANKCFRGTS